MADAFDFVKAINQKIAPNTEVQSLIDGDEFSKVVEKDFVPYLTNRNFSQFPDTLFAANEMNRYWRLSNRAKFLFYYHGIPQKKRFTQWAKGAKDEHEHLELIKEFYDYSDAKAMEVLPLLTDEDIQYITKKLDKGGIRK